MSWAVSRLRGAAAAWGARARGCRQGFGAAAAAVEEEAGLPAWPPPAEALRAAPELAEALREARAAQGETGGAGPAGPAPASSPRRPLAEALADLGFRRVTASALMRLRKAELRAAVEQSGRVVGEKVKKELLVKQVLRFLENDQLQQRGGAGAVHDFEAVMEVQALMEHLRKAHARRICRIDVSRASEVTNVLVIATGSSAQHLRRLAQAAVHEFRRNFDGGFATASPGVEGAGSDWVCVDFGSVLLHLLTEERRTEYDLEGLWADEGGGNVDWMPDAKTKDSRVLI